MSTTKQARPVAVVVQTHWDREWYFPHQTFIARLLLVMQKVATQLESGVLEQFLFDGQTAAYEDLLRHAEPALAQRVQSLVRQKRIVLGPWYVMADAFLVSGESLLRNLEIGIDDATAAGNCQRVGYLPDTFGHTGQLPQLLHNFGITSAVMWRGVDSPVAEFDWRAPDGSVVDAIFLAQGYYQHPLNVADWQVALERYLDLAAPRSLANEMLLTQGGDHLMSVDALATRIAEFNRSQTRYRLQQSSLAEHVATAMAQSRGQRQTITGALRNNTQAFVLPDVLSTRRSLKLLNQAAEDRLLGVVEPLWAQLSTDTIYPAKYLSDTWRMVIQNQAHDSICGCSVDAVHAEMLTRYQQIDQRLTALVEQAGEAGGLIAHQQHGLTQDVFADDSAFSLFNPRPKMYDGTCRVHLFLRGDRRDQIAITTASGDALISEVISVAPGARFRSPIDDFPDRIAGHEYELLVRCKIDGMAALACRVTQAPSASAAVAAPPENSIENACLRVAFLADGKLCLTNLREPAQSHQFGVLAELDAGDSYNFSPPPQQHQVLQRRFGLVSSRRTALMQELVLAVRVEVPSGLSADRRGRADTTVVNRGELVVRLYAGEVMADCRLTWTNAAMDQRTRLVCTLPTPVEVTWSDTGFEWGCYPVRYAAYPSAPSRQEMPVVVNPSLSAVLAGRLLFCHRAMQEYELLKVGDEQMLGVTLVRSVGWMSRRDLVTRGVGAGPDMATAEAQCLGEHTFAFQLGFVVDSSEHPLTVAEQFRRPPVLLTGHHNHWRAPFVLHTSDLQVSALRRVGDEIELRVWNPTSRPLSLAVSGGPWRRVRADGEPISATADVIAAYAIATLRCPQ
jgi:mannosylglycerate hydrolase